MKKGTQTSSGRRTFLKGVALAGGAATVAAAAGAATREPVTVPATTTEAAPAKQGYRETDHVREYYRLADM